MEKQEGGERLKTRITNCSRTGYRMASVTSFVFASFAIGACLAGGQELEYEFPPDRIGAPLVFPGNLSEGSGVVFIPEFNPADYGGDLTARHISSDRPVLEQLSAGGDEDRDGGEVWRASANVPDYDQRIVFSGDRPFRWQYLSQAHKIALGGEKDGPDLVNWLRGDSSREGEDPSDFRRRIQRDLSNEGSQNPIGAIVRSSVQRVGPPWMLSGDDKYAEFRVEHKTRAIVLYSVASDGKLHAFSEETGRELFAYVPQATMEKLPLLVKQEYGGESLMDGTPAVEDIFGAFPQCREPACWRTLLVGGLGTGGGAIYALDVTDPARTNELRAANEMFLWEFTSADLGYAISRPVITTLVDGTGIVLFGNGLPRHGEDSGSLFIVNAADGTLLQRIALPPDSGGVGLMSVTAWDADQDHAVDTVYAGDTRGRLWKFDLSTLESNGASPATIGCGGEPLISTSGAARTIPGPPLVSTLPGGGTIVIFGTGRVFTNGDLDTDFADGLYGIRDVDNCIGSLGTYPGDLALDEYRVVGTVDGVLRWLDSNRDPAIDTGWHVALPPGERIVNESTLSNGRVVFTTVNPMVPGNENWLYAVDYESGGAPKEPFMDINGDSIVDNADVPGAGIPVGRYVGAGLVSSVQVVDAAGGMDAHVYGHFPDAAWFSGDPPDGNEGGVEGSDGTSDGERGANGTVMGFAYVTGSALTSSRVSWREVR